MEDKLEIKCIEYRGYEIATLPRPVYIERNSINKVYATLLETIKEWNKDNNEINDLVKCLDKITDTLCETMKRINSCLDLDNGSMSDALDESLKGLREINEIIKKEMKKSLVLEVNN